MIYTFNFIFTISSNEKKIKIDIKQLKGQGVQYQTAFKQSIILFLKIYSDCIEPFDFFIHDFLIYDELILFFFN